MEESNVMTEKLNDVLGDVRIDAADKGIMEKLNGKVSDEDKKLFNMESKQKTQLIGSKEDKDEDGLTKEQREKLRKMYHDEVIRRFKTQFRQIADLMSRRHLTVMDVYDEVERKVSYLPRAARETIKGFKPEALFEYLKEFDVKEDEFGEEKQQLLKHDEAGI